MSWQGIAQFLAEQIGLDSSSIGHTALSTAVGSRQRALGMTDLEVYANHLSSAPDELAELADELVVPETWFFRGGDLFDYLVRHISERIAAGGPKIFRILSLACSSGEEPYSLAIALAEGGVPSNRWRIEAIDLDRRSLAKAEEGHYGEFSFRQTDPALRQRYFERCGNQWQISPALRERVVFRRSNAVDPHFLMGEGPFDLIFCRNLLIYLHRQARRQVLAHVERLLAPDGIIASGHVEPLDLLAPGFRRIGPDNCFLFQLDTASTARQQSAPNAGTASFLQANIAASVQPLPTRRSAAFEAFGREAAVSIVSRPNLAVGSSGEFERPAAQAISEISCAATLANDSLQLARSYANAGELELALHECNRHLQQHGPSADAFTLLGVVHRARHETRESGAAFQRALYLQPDHRECLTHLALLCEERGDFSQASLLRGRLHRLVGRGNA